MGNTTCTGNQRNQDDFFERNNEISTLVPGDKLDDDQVVKIKRQLVYKEKQQGIDLKAEAENLVAVTQHDGFKVPKIRFGKTELMVPIVTCGGMRVQQTWCPDDLPMLGTSTIGGIDKKCQANLIEIIRRALKLGINHFETARFYGTSELQYADALATLIESGEVKREDLIIQTKVRPFKTAAEFREAFEKSWKHMSRLGYIDLFSFHGVSSDEWYDMIFNKNDNGSSGDTDVDSSNMACAKELQKQGRIKHIGVSTHGTASLVRKLIESDGFAYINLHYHYFGSYHASGTPDGNGGQGNALNMQLAKDRDMGVFIISPFDKGGALYKPSATVASLVGPNLNPIAFSALWLWKLAPAPCHTLVVGAARPSDFDEVVAAARLLDDESVLAEASAAAARLDAKFAEAGYSSAARWWEGVPDFFDPKSGGVALGHILWLHGLVKAFGMYDFARARYGSLEGARGSWKTKEPFETNVKGWSFNPGLSFLPGPKGEAELASALQICPRAEEAKEDPTAASTTDKTGTSSSLELSRVGDGGEGNDRPGGSLDREPTSVGGCSFSCMGDPAEGNAKLEMAAQAVRECHGWLCKTAPPPTGAQREERGWAVAYNLVPWESFPGDSVRMNSVLLQQISGNRVGAGGGPCAVSKKEAKIVRKNLETAAEAAKVVNLTPRSKKDMGFFAY